MTQRVLQLFAALLCLAYAAIAVAQWAWRDDSGRLVFSDQPPPASVKPNQIVRQPAAAPEQSRAPVYTTGEKPAAPKAEAKVEAKAGAGKTATPASAAGPKTLAEREMESRKRAQEAGEAEKKAGEENKRKQQVAQDCERSRGYLRALEDGRRIARTDAQGNQVVLDDDARAAEVARVRSRIGSDCK